ncbi:MAG: acyl-ACP--UDP-N-acetylglucosamine O-acyltransferase [Planctomycetaceae bacterium]|nr:acyl-ACP--UDP-N-acetylglucosamine O-acyltransferase [Planctomycetaceae bacterium]
MAIHPSAVIEPGARIHASAEIGPFCVVGPKVSIGPGTKLIQSVTITGRTTLGARNLVHPFCVIGGDPQDLKFKGEDSTTLIGDENVIREGVTINKGTLTGGGQTVIGNRNMLMALAHVAHDCLIEDNCILANACLLAGHVRVESFAILSGWVVVHHFATVGQSAFIGGASRVNQDAPPFMILQGMSGEIRGVNSIGLKRRGLKPEVVNCLKEAYRIIWRSQLPKPEALAEVEKLGGQHPEVRTLIEFLRSSDQGHMGRRREHRRPPPAPSAPPPEPEDDIE